MFDKFFFRKSAGDTAIKKLEYLEYRLKSRSEVELKVEVDLLIFTEVLYRAGALR